MSVALAKGTAFTHGPAHVTATYGAEAWNLVLADMTAEDVATLSSIVAVGWYEHALVIRMLSAIERTLRDRDPKIIETLGRVAAESDLTRVHRVFLRMANPALVLEKSSELWSRFFDTGSWRVNRVERGADGILSGVGVVDEIFCRNLTAYLQRLFELVGAKNVTVRHAVCRARGDHNCEFVIRWR